MQAGERATLYMNVRYNGQNGQGSTLSFAYKIDPSRDRAKGGVDSPDEILPAQFKQGFVNPHPARCATRQNESFNITHELNRLPVALAHVMAASRRHHAIFRSKRPTGRRVRSSN